MDTITSIGVIDGENKLHVRFAITAIVQQIRTKTSLREQLTKAGQTFLANSVHEDIKTLSNELMFLKRLRRD